MRRKAKHKKLLTIIEGILFVLMMVSMSALDGTEITIPSTVLIASFVGLLICYRLEVGLGYYG